MKSRLLMIIGLPIIIGGLMLLVILLTDRPAAITSFYDCALAKNPVLESFPQVCKTADGLTFIEPVKTPTEFKIEDIRLGNGAPVETGDAVAVHYSGVTSDGIKFDNSYNRGEHFVFVVGAKQVIKGWDLGLLGMKPGGMRKLIIPPSLGYGDRKVGKIPANATLIFEVELLGIKDK